MGLPTFGFVTVHLEPLADGIACEAGWLAGCAATGRAVAHLWRAPPGLVVPRRYTMLPGWPALGPAWQGRLQVRASGGGVVPQGPGVWNLSLVWPVPAAAAGGSAPVDPEGIYRALSGALAAAVARLGIQAGPQAVPGSFCDGRYNLAVAGRKLAGTAQAWKRVAGRPLVLAHAVIVVAADPHALTEQANALEEALGTPVRYRAQVLTSIACAAPDATDIEARTLRVLAEQFARVLPPRVLS